jgi:hypothetical protein
MVNIHLCQLSSHTRRLIELIIFGPIYHDEGSHWIVRSPRSRARALRLHRVGVGAEEQR